MPSMYQQMRWGLMDLPIQLFLVLPWSRKFGPMPHIIPISLMPCCGQMKPTANKPNSAFPCARHLPAASGQNSCTSLRQSSKSAAVFLAIQPVMAEFIWRLWVKGDKQYIITTSYLLSIPGKKHGTTNTIQYHRSIALSGRVCALFSP